MSLMLNNYCSLEPRIIRPKLVMASNLKANKDIDVDFAIKNGFDGVDWSFSLDRMPFDNESKTHFISQVRKLEGHHVEVRFHAPFHNAEIGYHDDGVSQWAMELYLETLEIIFKAGGQFLTLHIGLGNIEDEKICLVKVLKNLQALKDFGIARGVTISLENLMYGPTSFPEEWIEILEEVDIPATFDFGHAKGCAPVLKGLWTPLEMLYQVKERLIHAHIYKEENGDGHVPPDTIDDMGEDLLDVMIDTSCKWWVIELPEKKALLHTKELLKTYIESSLSGV